MQDDYGPRFHDMSDGYNAKSIEINLLVLQNTIDQKIYQRSLLYVFRTKF